LLHRSESLQMLATVLHKLDEAEHADVSPGS